MIIEIEEELFNKLKELIKNRSKTIYEQLEQITPVQNVPTNSLQQARDIKTGRVKETIKQTIKELLNANISPTKYQINKMTGIAFITLNKYYDDILEEVQNEKIITTTI
jgi:hypothetical protein